MYDLLRRYLPAGAVNAVMTLWYLLLALLIYLFSSLPDAWFTYRDL